MRIKDPDADDKKKLVRIMKYIQATKDVTLILEANKSGQIKWWVYAAFSVYPNMISHIDSMLSLKKGAAVSTSKKKKSNTKSSTKP